MAKNNIMSIHTFNELIDNMEEITKLTLHGRKSIKYYVKKMQNQLQDIEKLVQDSNTDISKEILKIIQG